MTIQLSQADETLIAQHHKDAATGITGLAASVPTSVNGGEGSAALLAILAAVVKTADSLAQINEAAYDQVTAVGQGLGTNDDAVGDVFRKMTGKLP